jgi:short-subunit dehydrogenase
MEQADFAHGYGPWAVVAGASEGLGASLADQLAARGVNLILIARTESRLRDVAAGVTEHHGVDTRLLPLDLTDADCGDRIAAAAEGLDIGLVVYNAGAANRTTTFLEDTYEDSLQQIQLACIGPVALARQFAPAMKERGRGGIVLVGSLACLVGAAHVVVYSAVKMFNVNLAEGLWAELHPSGVDVCATPLGRVYTPALQRMGVPFNPDADLLPEDAASEILDNIGNGPVHVVGATNRANAARIWTVDRRAAVEAMSASTRAFASQRVDHG